MPAYFETGENVTVAKFELASTRCRNNLKTVGNLMVKNFLQDFDAKEMYLHSKNRSAAFQKYRKIFYFHHFRVSKPRCFQNVLVVVPFSKSTASKSAGKKCAVFM